jgi:hypothetical protein
MMKIKKIITTLENTIVAAAMKYALKRKIVVIVIPKGMVTQRSAAIVNTLVTLLNSSLRHQVEMAGMAEKDVMASMDQMAPTVETGKRHLRLVHSSS